MFSFEIGAKYLVTCEPDSYPVLDRNCVEINGTERVGDSRLAIQVIDFPDDKPGFMCVLNLDSLQQHLYQVAKTLTAKRID